jgi:hypothetical protein
MGVEISPHPPHAGQKYASSTFHVSGCVCKGAETPVPWSPILGTGTSIRYFDKPVKLVLL